MRMSFNLREACLIVDVLRYVNEAEKLTSPKHYIFRNCACRMHGEGFVDKWGCSGSGLVGRLSRLTEKEAGELLSCIEKFWLSSPQEDMESGLWEAGFPLDISDTEHVWYQDLQTEFCVA